MNLFPLNRMMAASADHVLPSAWTGHVPFAFWLTEAARPRVFVELGTHHGTSFLAFCQAIRALGVPCLAHAVDTWEGDEHAGFYGNEVHEHLARIVADRYSGFAQLMRMRFDQALGYFSEGSVDALHIDGLHTHDAVAEDFHSWLPKLSSRGIVLFHDTQVRERGFGVWRLWESLRRDYPAFEFTHTHGLGVLLVGPDQPAALKQLCGITDPDQAAAVSSLFEAMGQRVIKTERASYFEALHADQHKLVIHYKAVWEQAVAELEAARSRIGEFGEAEREVASRALSERAESAAVAQQAACELAAERALAETLERQNAALRQALLDQQAAANEEVRRSQEESRRLHGELQVSLQSYAQLAAELASQRNRIEASLGDASRREQELRAASAQRDRQLAEQAEQIGRLEERLAASGREASLRQRDVEKLAGELADRDGLIARQLDALRDHELRIASLGESLGDRILDVQKLTDEVSDRDKAMALQADEIKDLQSRAVALAGLVEEQKLLTEQRSSDCRALSAKLDELLARESELRMELAQTKEEGMAKQDELRAAAEALGREREKLREAKTKVDELADHLDATLQALQGSRDAERTLEARLAEFDARLHAAATKLRHRELQLADAMTRLGMQQDVIDRLVGSKSWRMTTGVRWLRAKLAAVLGRADAPTWEQLRGVPTAPSAQPLCDEAPHMPEPSAPPVDAMEASGVAPFAKDEKADEIARTYLADIFAVDDDRRAPEYRAAWDLPPPLEVRAKAIAFYLPQFHLFPENEAWWGKGFTEWTNVTKAVPQFVGHHQPRLPSDLGFYDLANPDTISRQIALARQHGLHGFAFHYYWFGGKRLMEKPLDLFLGLPGNDFPFCICWANENWTRRWDGLENEVLIAQEHGPENDLAFISDLAPLLRDPRYIRVDGKPLLIVYRPSILPDAAATLKRWRQYCREHGIGEIYLAMAQFDVEDPRIYGFDAALEFPPHKLAKGFDSINGHLDIVNPSYAGHVNHYQAIVDSARQWPKPDYALIRGVFPGWDNEARRPGRGYTFAYSTPERYREWLELAVRFAEANPLPGGEKLVMINAWNEWAEGAHLEPDRRYGHAYLQATREALAQPRVGPKLLVVSHDAHPHGAQYLALNMVKELIRMGAHVEVALLGGGPLLPAFSEVATVHEVFGMDDDGVRRFAREQREAGVDLVLANTAVSGRIAPALEEAGLRTVGLVHELPGVIQEYGLEQAVRDLAHASVSLVAGSSAVAGGLSAYLDGTGLEERLQVRSQGLFTRSRYRGLDDLGPARAALRARFGLPADARVVLAVGYADRRKGVDLLAEVAVQLADIEDLHFIWVGHRDVGLVNEVAATLERGRQSARFHFAGLDFDTDDYYAGADVYALVSREDPFPSVVLESLSVGTPVLAFAGTGGGADLVAAHGGRVVLPATAEAYAMALRDLLHDRDECARLGSAGRELIDRKFAFRKYMMDLLAIGGVSLPRVSVVVPNYNYGRYLAQRLQSIAGQTLPIYEIIVLDDASTDDSRDVLRQLRSALAPEPRLIFNETNSGSVFRQWHRGVAEATGDYVWIAEADDLSAPDFLERIMAAMHADPSIVMGYSQSVQIDEAGATLAADYHYYTDELSPTRWKRSYVADGGDEARAALCVKNAVPNVSGVVFRREALAAVLDAHLDDILSYHVAGDWLVYLQMAAKGRVAFVADACNVHRRHGGSVTLGSAARQHLEEVRRVQAAAAALHSPDDAVRSAAKIYAERLRDHFGLAETK